MHEKALKTLDSANHLFSAGYIDSATSRFYYAAYQAVVYRLGKNGLRYSDLSDDVTYWKHSLVIDNASLIRGRKKEDRAFLVELFDLRVKADYDIISVKDVELKASIKEIEKFVKELIA